MEALFWMLPLTAILGAFAFIIVLTLSRARIRELQIRERIAMIERGLMPPPEVDPRGFDYAMSKLDSRDARREARRYAREMRRRDFRRGGGRHRRAGVTLMGVGFGLMVLIGVAGDSPQNAIGVGGFLVVMGLAFFVNSLIDTGTDQPSGSWSGTPPNTAPPQNGPN
jgi:hypothetical protein